MRGWIELRPVARQQDAPGRTLRRTRGATPSARVLPKGGTGSSVRCSCGPAEDGCRERNRSQETRKTASSAAVKGPMRSMSNRPNQTRVVRLDAFGCSTVRLSAATHPLSLVDFRDVRIPHQNFPLRLTQAAPCYNRSLTTHTPTSTCNRSCVQGGFVRMDTIERHIFVLANEAALWGAPGLPSLNLEEIDYECFRA